MTDKETIIDWLRIGLQQPEDWVSEIFYFDKRDNQFFSVLITDYFLFDSELNLAKNTTSGYSEKSLKILRDRIIRIDKNDLSILAIPRVGQKTELEIQEQIKSFLEINSIDLGIVTIWETDDEATITIKIIE
jgi:hypothetical protein